MISNSPEVSSNFNRLILNSAGSSVTNHRVSPSSGWKHSEDLDWPIVRKIFPDIN